MKAKICLLSLLLVASLPAWGALYSYTSSTPAVIPDNNTLGLTLTATPANLGLVPGGDNWSISALTLTFTLQGGVASDLSGYLRLGNAGSSPSYNITGLGAEAPAGTTYTLDFTTSGFQTAFNGQNPNDTWTLFFADTVPGDTTTLNGWSLAVTAVPEPVNVALIAFLVILTGGWVVRRWIRTVNPKGF